MEIDEQQVNLTRFSLFFPEKRDFFLEGQGIFDFAGSGARRGGGPGETPILFFSRRIGLNAGRPVPIQVGGRLMGRVGRLSMGVLNIQTEDAPEADAVATNFSVVRVKRDVLRRSNIGMILTNRSPSTPGSGSNRVYGVDANMAFYENLRINGCRVESGRADRPFHRPLNQTARAVFPQAAFLSCSSFGIRCVAAGGGFVRTAFGSFAKGTIQVHDISAFPIARTFTTEYGDFPLQRAFWTRQRRCSKQRSETLCLPSRS